MASLGNSRLRSFKLLGLALKQAAVEAGREIWAQRKGLLSIIVGCLLAELVTAVFLLRHHHGDVDAALAVVTPVPRDLRHITSWLFGRGPFTSAASALLVAIIVVDRGNFFGFVVYLLRRDFGFPKEVAETLRDYAYFQNVFVGVTWFLTEIAVCLFSMVVMPCLAPLLLCLLPAMHYVAFKELFDPDGLPELKEERAPLSASLAPTAAD